MNELEETQVQGVASTPSSPPAKPLCKHCHRKAVCRPRGLCWGCYHTPEIKAQYGAVDGNNWHGPTGRAKRSGNRREYPLPSCPSSALPGTEDKVRELELRVERGEELHHPEDLSSDLD